MLLNSYNNTAGTALSEQRACESTCTDDCACDNVFTFCLRAYGSSISDSDIYNCPLGGNITSKVYPNMNIFDFGSALGTSEDPVPNPIRFTGESWPVSNRKGYFLLFEGWDRKG